MLAVASKEFQCTPDLLPSDVTGTSIFNQKTGEFDFRSGPVFTQILLADEINRATPRTQASLLEAMAESRVTADGVTHTLEAPFVVIATQSPVDHEGTFPLPEAQLDRFMMKFSLGYPSMEEELRMLELMHGTNIPLRRCNRLQPQNKLELLKKSFVKSMSTRVRQYLLKSLLKLADILISHWGGARERRLRCSGVHSAVWGVPTCCQTTSKKLFGPVMNHRVIIRPESRLRKVTAEKVIEEIVGEIAVPTITPKFHSTALTPDHKKRAAQSGIRKGKAASQDTKDFINSQNKKTTWLAKMSFRRRVARHGFARCAGISGLLLAGMLFGSALWIISGVVALLLTLINAWLTKTWSEGVHARREEGDLETKIGSLIHNHIELENRSKIPVIWLLVEDLIPVPPHYSRPLRQVDGERIDVMKLGGTQKKSVQYQIRCNRRGYFQIGPTMLETGDLMGFFVDIGQVHHHVF